MNRRNAKLREQSIFCITHLERIRAVIITIAGYKGGIAKTTSAVHLAAFLQSKAPTLFIDSDENRSAVSWARQEKLPFEVTTENLAPKRIMSVRPEHIVIDTKARPSSEELEEISTNCDLMVLPSTTRPMDIAALMRTVKRIKEIGTPFRVLLTMVPPTSSKMSAEIKELLGESKVPVFDSTISRYTFVEQLPLDGILANKSKDKNAKTVWTQYMRVGKEILK